MNLPARNRDDLATRMTLGELIWLARDRKGLNQTQLAAMLLVSRPQLANLETGRGNPSLETLMEIALACECSFATDGDYWWIV